MMDKKHKLDLNDHARLRHNRDRNLGFQIGHYIQPPPYLFNRDGLNVFLGDIYRGQSAFLILGGPSFGTLINGESEFRGKKVSNRELLNGPGFVTMATNNAPRTFRPNLWTLVDDPGNFIKSIWLDPKITKFVPFDHSEKRIFDNEAWKEMDTVTGECPNVHFYRRNEHFVPTQFLQEGTFNWGEHSDSVDGVGNKGGRSVMLVALKMLYYLGVRKVFLLGCDFKMDDNTKYHFDQDRSPGSQKGNNSTYQILKTRFEALLPEFEKVGFKVFNCNMESGLTVFPMIPFEEAIQIATKDMPDVANERTAGLYDRKAQEKNKGVAPNQPAKTTIDLTKPAFTEEDKKVAKQELDRHRKILEDLKHARDTYKLMPDADVARLAILEQSVVKARSAFKEAEVIKNKVWGIVKA
jgi:hypothetical protein